MSQFILVTHTKDYTLRISVYHILAYHPDNRKEGGTMLMMSDGAPIYARETPDQIDRLIDPTRTP